MHKLSLVDRLRGWHYKSDGTRCYNWCGCEVRS